ncbi:MAG: hypothetical protein ACLU3I_22345 [Acutalibacteraceae bacterium]
MVGCNNPKVRPDTAHIELMKKLLKNDIIVIVSGCSAQAAAKAGLMDLDAAEYCGEGLKRVCKLVGIPPILHMGSCVDISRMMILASDLAKDWGINISQIPLCGCAPEWMSEKAVSIGNYVVATGIDTYLGVDPYSKGSSEITELLQGETGCKEWVEAHFVVETDIESLGDKMIERDRSQARRARHLRSSTGEVFTRYESSYHRQGRRRQDDAGLHARTALRRRGIAPFSQPTSTRMPIWVWRWA